MLQFGFDVDSLEIHLNELYDNVDKFFILESTRTHFRTVRKPLLWERVRLQPRFQKFSDKIIPFTLDDAESAHLSEKVKTFALESLQERLRWEKFLQWNNSTRFFEDHDLLGELKMRLFVFRVEKHWGYSSRVCIAKHTLLIIW